MLEAHRSARRARRAAASGPRSGSARYAPIASPGRHRGVPLVVYRGAKAPGGSKGVSIARVLRLVIRIAGRPWRSRSAPACARRGSPACRRRPRRPGWSRTSFDSAALALPGQPRPARHHDPRARSAANDRWAACSLVLVTAAVAGYSVSAPSYSARVALPSPVRACACTAGHRAWCARCSSGSAVPSSSPSASVTLLGRCPALSDGLPWLGGASPWRSRSRPG